MKLCDLGSSVIGEDFEGPDEGTADYMDIEVFFNIISFQNLPLIC